MCLITSYHEPMVALQDIKVYKYAIDIDIDSKVAYSPYQGNCFHLNQEFKAEPSDMFPHQYYDGKHWTIGCGAIHAYLWPAFNKGRHCYLEAYIPKGTEYWVGTDNCTIAARKLFITDKIVESKDCAGLDLTVSKALYDAALKNNGITVGDFLVHGEYIKPYAAKEIPKIEIQGIVVGFNGDIPEVADIQNLMKNISIDTNGSSKLDKCIPERDEAIKDMDGYEHFKAWKQICKEDLLRYEAYRVVSSLSENHYIPAFGEMELIWFNLLYIAAGCSLAGVNCPFARNEWYWTSTEAAKRSNWASRISNYYGGADNTISEKDYFIKHDCRRIVPFIASDSMKEKVE